VRPDRAEGAADDGLAVELITIGDELLLGFTIDTNAAHLARTLAAVGGRIVRRASVGDDATAIADAVREALDRTGAVITTGGLGPTADDLTKQAIGALFGRALALDEALLAELEARWQRRFNHPLPPSNRQQVMIPEGAEVLPNRHGSAPGIWLEDERGRWVAMLPGVPREMRGMLADTLLPRLDARLSGGARVIRSRTLRTVGIAESALADRLGDLARGVDGLPLAYLPGAEGVDLRVTARNLTPGEADHRLGVAVEALRARVGAYVYGEDDADLAALVVQGCRVRGWTVAVAESCTGGMLGMRLTAVPGASDVVLGGVIAYANAVKVRDLDVPAALLEAEGAVSEGVARAMASGVRARCQAAVGIGITGIAGPGGGTPEKPVGTVWVAVDLNGTVHAARAVFPGDRHEIRFRAAQAALDRLRRALEGTEPLPAWTTRA
jgi:nicotinamide-nucleotide amidase